MRRRVVGLLAVAVTAGLGIGVYARYFRATALAETPKFEDTGDRLPNQEEFEALVKSDPVKLLEVCLTRYQREVKGGITATLVKRERVYGEPKPPKEPQEEVIRLSVRNDVAGDSATPRPQVRMVWESGARKALLGMVVRGTLFVEEMGGGQDDIAALTAIGISKTPVSGTPAKGASRYCMADAGLYRAMLRSHTVWKKRQDDGALHWRFVEKRAVPEVGGRVCYVVERTCPNPESIRSRSAASRTPQSRQRRRPGVGPRHALHRRRAVAPGRQRAASPGRLPARRVLLPRHQPEPDLRGRHVHDRRAEEGGCGSEEVNPFC